MPKFSFEIQRACFNSVIPDVELANDDLAKERLVELALEESIDGGAETTIATAANEAGETIVQMPIAELIRDVASAVLPEPVADTV